MYKGLTGPYPQTLAQATEISKTDTVGDKNSLTLEDPNALARRASTSRRALAKVKKITTLGAKLITNTILGFPVL